MADPHDPRKASPWAHDDVPRRAEPGQGSMPLPDFVRLMHEMWDPEGLRARVGPFRSIVGVLAARPTTKRVRLACGHEVTVPKYAKTRVRCRRCRTTWEPGG